MKSLFLAWQAPNRAWFPVGRLDADVAQQHYHFGYTKGALQAEHAVGFRPLPAFLDFERTYESSELFPLFQNRVIDSSRKDFGEGKTRNGNLRTLSRHRQLTRPRPQRPELVRI